MRIPLSNFGLWTAGVCGLASVTLFMRHTRGKMSDRVAGAPYYKEAIKLLENDLGAQHLLGQTIRQKRMNMYEIKKDDLVNLTDARLEVPVHGSKGKGVCHVHAWRPEQEAEDKRQLGDRLWSWRNAVLLLRGTAADGHDVDGGWVLDTVELELEKTTALLPEQHEGKKLVVYNQQRHGPLEDFWKTKQQQQQPEATPTPAVSPPPSSS